MAFANISKQMTGLSMTKELLHAWVLAIETTSKDAEDKQKVEERSCCMHERMKTVKADYDR